jgi:glycosyltransferase involved in cell wall biosynthesis
VTTVAPTARLCIVGEGREREALERRVAELGLEHVVSLLGLRRDVERILASSDVYASASSYEGLPLATLEAMHAGLPVVATDVGDVAHVVTQDTGRVVMSGDRGGLAREIAALVDDESLRARLGCAGRLRATERFGTAQWAERHRQIYAELAGARRPGEASSCAS